MIGRLFATCLLMAAYIMAQAQNVSIPTGAYNPNPVFTPVTTFSQAGSTVSTVLTGVGPSVMPGAATFSYGKPVSTVQGYTPTAVYSSLAAAGQPTNAQGAIIPPTTPDLIIVNPNAASSLAGSRIAAAAVAAAAAIYIAA